MCTETGAQKMGMSTRWVFTLPTNIAKLITPKLKLPLTWKRTRRKVYPGKFLLTCCWHLLLIFFCLSSQTGNPLPLFRLTHHRVVGLTFSPVPLRVSDFSFNQSICASDFLFHLLQASPQHLSLPFCSLIQSPHRWPQSQGWKPMALVIKLSHTWVCVTFSTNTPEHKCCCFTLNFGCWSLFSCHYLDIMLLPWTLWWQAAEMALLEFHNLTFDEGRTW